MSLKPLHLISVGRPKAIFWREAADHYLERLCHWHEIQENVIRDANSALPVQQRKAEEGKRILEVVTKHDIIVCLDEHGKHMTSVRFSQFLAEMSSDLSHAPCFIVGGPFGLDKMVLERASHTLSFGPQTLPHELARVVLLEQLYRAESIIRNSPYHHE